MAITVHTNEVFERVFINEPEIDMHIIQESGSRVKIHILNLSLLPGSGSAISLPQSAGKQCNRLVVDQQGKGCSTEVYALAFLSGKEHLTTETHLTHAVGGGSSNQLVKFILDGEAEGHFIGDLKIAADAQQTEAHQTNRNLLLSEQAQMRTQPQLEIYADDVQATHGASTGQLDEAALFYMQQRGLSKEKARQLLVGAFMKDVLETIGDDTLRQSLLDAVDGVVE